MTCGKAETLTIAKDSTGELWVTYVENSKVIINHVAEENTGYSKDARNSAIPYLNHLTGQFPFRGSLDRSLVGHAFSYQSGEMKSTPLRSDISTAVGLTDDFDTGIHMSRSFPVHRKLN